MKIMIISDIHGDINALNHIINILENESIDKLICLGDFCSYYDDSLDIANRLNSIKDKLICVRGNCDTEVFVNTLQADLPIYNNIMINNHPITITHGHIYNPHYLPKKHGNIIISGHTHRKEIKYNNGLLILNPGSISRPRDGIASYILINNNNIYLKDINDNIIDSRNLDEKIV